MGSTLRGSIGVTSTNYCCGVVDAVTFDFSKPTGETVMMSTILQEGKDTKVKNKQVTAR